MCLDDGVEIALCVTDKCDLLRFTGKLFAKVVLARVEEFARLKETSHVRVYDVLEYSVRDASEEDGSVVRWRSPVTFFLKTARTIFPVRQSFEMMPLETD